MNTDKKLEGELECGCSTVVLGGATVLVGVPVLCKGKCWEVEEKKDANKEGKLENISNGISKKNE